MLSISFGFFLLFFWRHPWLIVVSAPVVILGSSSAATASSPVRWHTPNPICSSERVRTTSVSLSSSSGANGWIWILRLTLITLLLAPGSSTPVTRRFLLHLGRLGRWWIPNVRIFALFLVFITNTWLFNEHLMVNFWLISKNVSHILVLFLPTIWNAMVLERSKASKSTDHLLDPTLWLVLIRFFRAFFNVRIRICD